MATISKREQILTALSVFAAQRPGFDPGNYSDWKSYRSEVRSVTRDLHIVRQLMGQVSWRESIGEAELREAFRAYSGRLSIVDRADGSIELEYCTGQYFPTEYRKAVCAVLASALWAHKRDSLPAGTPEPGTRMRKEFRREYGHSIASRFFD
jgi:hypothetical protein